MRALTKLSFYRLLILLALLSLLGCSHSGPKDLSAQMAGKPLAPATRNFGLPAPTSLTGVLRETSAQTLAVSGSGFDLSLPRQNVFAAGNQGIFTSSFGTKGGSFGDLAFAIYRLNVAGFAGDLSLRMRTGSPFQSFEELFIAFADFSADRWSYQVLPASGPVSLDASGFANGSGDILVAVVMAGSGQFKLDELTFNTYDEVENNDSIATANTLPTGAFSGYRGSIGNDVGYPGYDGDNADYFSIPFALGDELNYSIGFNGETGQVKYSFKLADGSEFITGDTTNAFGNTKLGFAELDGPFGNIEEDDFPLTLLIEPLSGFTDYTLSVTLNTRPSAVLSVDKRQGNVPLTVNFDATGSSDPEGDTLSYDYEVRGDDWSLFVEPDSEIHTASPQLAHTFTSEGIYKVTLRAKDSTGQTSLNQDVVILVGSSLYNEIEDNDTNLTSQVLDSVEPVDGLHGNVGTFGPFDSGHFWDGDNVDYYSLVVPSGQTVCFLISGSVFADFYFETENDLLESGSVIYAPFAGVLQGRRNNSSEGAPVVIRVAGEGDYSLTWSVASETPSVAATATPDGGNPRTIHFDAHSTPVTGSSIRKVIWDTAQDDDDLNPILIQGETPTYTYAGSGTSFDPQVVAIDANGLAAHQEFELDL